MTTNTQETICYGSRHLDCLAFASSGVTVSVVPFRYCIADGRALEWLHVIFKNQRSVPVSLWPLFFPTFTGKFGRLSWRFSHEDFIIHDLQPEHEHGVAFPLPSKYETLQLLVRADEPHRYERDGTELLIGERQASGLWGPVSNELESAFWDPSGPENETHHEVRFLADAVLASIRREPALLSDMRPGVFERLVGEVFARGGFQVTMTARSADGGVDVFAVCRLGLSPTSHVIQCKRYRDKIGVQFVRELYAVKADAGASKAVLVTTSSFTRPAVQFAERHSWEISLVDGTKLLEWIRHETPKMGT